MPIQKRFLDSQAMFRIARGGVRAGKTLCCAFELARALRGEHPRWGKSRPLTVYIVVDKEDHIGRVIYDKLFRAGGTFDIIRDEVTNQWRVFDIVRDAHRKAEKKPAPPLIPNSWIEHGGISWYNKGTRAFQVVRMKPLSPEWPRGSEIYAFSGRADPPQGQPIDIGWIDEDLSNDNVVPELLSRTFDLGGILFWSALPHDSCDSLVTASEMAESQIGEQNPTHEEFVMSILDNIHINDEFKAERIRAMSNDPDVIRQRIYGEFGLNSALMYPMFHKATHQIPREHTPLEIDRAVEQGIPHTWTRYLAIDPGYSKAAAIFAAVPPPDLGDYVVIYDEVLMSGATAERLAEELAAKGEGQSFEKFIIDEHGSRVHEAGSGVTIKAQYSAAFRKYGLRSNLTGFGFQPGDDDREARAGLVRSYLSISGETGTARLLILKDRCPQLVDAMRKYKKWKSGNGSAMKDVADPRSAVSHLPNCLEYLIAARPKWSRPKPPPPRISPVLKEKEEWDRAAQRLHGAGYINLGPVRR